MSFLIHFIFSLLLAKKGLCIGLNVGTVLFTKADLYKECWQSENVALLTSRMILEDLLPSPTVLIIDSNEFVTDLVEYFRLILETVRRETQGKIKHITLTAVTDLLGGYLHHAVLPIARYAYYSGLIDYDSVATLLGLFDELKFFLRTNGQGWAKPSRQSLDNFEIQKIPLQPCNDKTICDNFILVEGDKGNDPKSTQCDITIPLPFFDSVTQPNAIALPTKIGPLYSVEANSSSFLVMNFFVGAYKCLQMKKTRQDTLEKFENDISGWIEDQILPRLEDEKFYSAFGGILRVRTTIKKLGSDQSELGKQLEEFQHSSESTEVVQEPQKMSKSAMILTAALITIFIWFLLGTLFICFKIKHSRMKDADDEDGKTTTASVTSSKACQPDKKTGICKGSGYRHQITIKTCSCDEKADKGANLPSTRSTTPTATETNVTSNQTDSSRLPSITELSESTLQKDDSRGEEMGRKTPAKPTEDDAGAVRRISSLRLYEEDTTETEEEESSPD